MRLIVVSLLAGFLLLVPGGAAHAAKTCPTPPYPSANGSYSGEIKSKNVPCKKVEKLLVKEWKCRTKTGPEGRCVSYVMHFACREERYSDFYASDFFGSVTCTHHNQKVTWAYYQSKATP